MKLVLTFRNENATLPSLVYVKHTKRWLLFNQNSVFNLGYKITNNTVIELKIKTPVSNLSKWRQVIGAYNDGGLYYGWGLYTNLNNSYFGMNGWHGNSYNRIASDTLFSYTTETVYVLKIEVGTGKITDMLTETILSSSLGNNSAETLNTPLYVGNVPFSLGDPGFNGKVYYIKIYENTDPSNYKYFEAHKDILNQYGLLEIKSKTVIYNTGSAAIEDYGEDA